MKSEVYIVALWGLLAGALWVFDRFFDALIRTAGLTALSEIMEAAIGAGLLMALYFSLRVLNDDQRKRILFGDNKGSS
ncbi:MAG: hypothetical protein ACXVH6_04970 [Halobacteriota archaeon]